MNNSMGLKPGVCFTVGTRGSGKTRTLAWLAEEFASQGLPVYGLFIWDVLEDHPDLARLKKRYPEIHYLDTVAEMLNRLRNAKRGSVFLLDDIDMKSIQQNAHIIGSGRRLLDTLVELDTLAKELGHITVFAKAVLIKEMENPLEVSGDISAVPIYFLG